jgi:hypothetical protein
LKVNSIHAQEITEGGFIWQVSYCVKLIEASDSSRIL